VLKTLAPSGSPARDPDALSLSFPKKKNKLLDKSKVILYICPKILNMYALRKLEKLLNEINNSFPVITITGPRQSGKTTLVRNYFKELPYFSFENPDIRFVFENDPRKFLKSLTKGAIFDEFQNVPHLTSYLQEIVDTNFVNVCFVLTGSNQFDLINRVNQSLAGRTVMLKLLTFSISEIEPYVSEIQTNGIIFKGLYPGIYFRKQSPLLFYRSYFETYIERDLRNLINIKDLSTFQKFIRLCAGRIGQVLNMNSLANETGISIPTIKAWISALQSSFILYLLPPYYENINKRLVKSPKLYFYDTGLACFLLGIEEEKQLERDPSRGSLFENLVINEFVKDRSNKGLESNLFFYRDKTNEIDLIVKKGNKIDCIEIKSSETYHPHFNKNLKHLKKHLTDLIDKQYIIYDGGIEMLADEISILTFKNLGLKEL
jgi:uncharacterized protein